MLVEIPTGQKLVLEHDFVLGLLGDLITLLEHVLDLIPPLIEKIFELIILIAIFAPCIPPGRKDHVLQFLLLLGLLAETRD